MKPDYLNLAKEYASFLVALGGISITVLTLILAFREPADKKSYSASIIALVVATLACFVGAHLMSQTGALFKTNGNSNSQASGQTQFANQNQSPGDGQAATNTTTPEITSSPMPETTPSTTPEPSGERHFIYASIDVYVALMLTGFAMMLLPTAYITGHEGGVPEPEVTGISKITTLVFCFILASAYFWTIYFYSLRIKTDKPWDWIAEASLAGVALILFVWVVYFAALRWVIKEKHFPQFTFYLQIGIIAFTVGSFAYLGRSSQDITDVDVVLFCVAISFSGASLAGHGLKIKEREGVKHRSFSLDDLGSLICRRKNQADAKSSSEDKGKKT